MVRLSRYSHIFKVDEAVALYHSLRMKPVFLSCNAYESLQAWLANPFSIFIEEAPEHIKHEVQELKRWKILITEQDEDDKVLNFIRNRIPDPGISVCYMILSEQCNLACKYCFLGNNDSDKRKRFEKSNMTIEIAERAVQFYISQLHKSGLDFEHTNPVVIFYGGEPLINFETLVYIAKRLLSLKETEICLRNLELSIVTNGLLLNKERITILKNLNIGVAISIDGFTEEENEMRVDVNGRTVFKDVLRVLDMCKAEGLDVSLSVTLSLETIKKKESVLELVGEYGIKSIGFNILMSSDTFKVPESYGDEAAEYIIDVFCQLRKLGIYEDRMIRKIDAFSKAQVYYSDCAATNGGQIVISPVGKVGICHGCLHDKKYFVTDIYDQKFDCKTNASFIEWSQITPINNDECQKCPALGICGGGCPLNASYLKKGNTIHSVDKRFCPHAIKTLEFLIKDLYRLMKERNS